MTIIESGPYDVDEWQPDFSESDEPSADEIFSVVRVEDFEEDAASDEPEDIHDPFPINIFPSPVSQFAIESSQSIGCDVGFVAVPMLSAIASAIGNSSVVEAKADWTEPATIWTVTIADAGSCKSIAANSATRFVHDRHRKQADDFFIAMGDYENAKLVWESQSKKERGEPPKLPAHERCLVSDTTIEALVETLHVNPRGVLLHRDELAGLFGSFDEYKNRSSDCANYLSMFRSEPITTDRKVNRAIRYIPRANVSITGSIQPDILNRCLSGENTENGLASRFLMCRPPSSPKQWSDIEVDPLLVGDMEDLFRELFAIPLNSSPTRFPLSSSARKRFSRFVNEHGIETHNEGGAIGAAFAKLEAYVLRFALVFHLVDCIRNRVEGNQSVIHENSIERGIQLAEWFKRETRRVYRSFGGYDSEVHDLVELIRTECGGEITARELRAKRRKYRAAGTAQQALEDLKEKNLGRFETRSTDGRPATLFVLTNIGTRPLAVS